ncbi:MAG: SufE family protein [Verrucomicrobiota bacterium]|nr:SufE family protein [Verrucomicrobiota bacterium]MED5453692.1 SufE family protein [Verrucomicrobiota bacterium]|tara:strand:- start:398 stop:853 length:456 start_codon:yes stop_codon:yes gene_type:complete
MSISLIEMATVLDTTIDELIENFEFLGDWEERFAYLIELGKKLPALDDAEMIDEYRVHGCQASVWLRILPSIDDKFEIRADSDAFIVKGLIAVLLLIYNGKTATQILDVDSSEIFGRLGLDKHLSPTRRNGLHSMVKRIKTLASDSITQSP